MHSSQQHTRSETTQGNTHAAGKKGMCLADNRGVSTPVQRKANNTGLPDHLKSGIENLSGHSMDDVKVHYNSSAPSQLSAHAYAQGTNIHIAPGQEKHLPHEAWHVVQQKQGRVKPTMQMKSKVNVNDDDSLEKEADTMGTKAMSSAEFGTRANRLRHTSVGAPVVQGGGLLTAGIVAGSILTGGLGALAYGAYRLYRHRRRENTLNSITREQANQNVAVTHLPAHTGPDVPSTVRAVNGGAPQAHRNYQVEINPNNPLGLYRDNARGEAVPRTSPALIRTAEVHERTHISADQAYSANQHQSQLSLMHGDPNAADFGDHSNEQFERIDARLQELRRIVLQDSALTEDQRADILQRVRYAGNFIEYDPVINELLHHTKEEGIRANSKTVKALVLLARENLVRRQPGGPNLRGDWPS